jgi:hypothetical protein
MNGRNEALNGFSGAGEIRQVVENATMLRQEQALRLGLGDDETNERERLVASVVRTVSAGAYPDGAASALLNVKQLRKTVKAWSERHESDPIIPELRKLLSSARQYYKLLLDP